MLTPEQKVEYERVRQMALADLDELDKAIVSELSRVKKRLLELQEDKKAVKQMLDGASARLGVASVAPLKDINLAELSAVGERREAMAASA